MREKIAESAFANLIKDHCVRGWWLALIVMSLVNALAQSVRIMMDGASMLEIRVCVISQIVHTEARLLVLEAARVVLSDERSVMFRVSAVSPGQKHSG